MPVGHCQRSSRLLPPARGVVPRLPLAGVVRCPWKACIAAAVHGAGCRHRERCGRGMPCGWRNRGGRCRPQSLRSAGGDRVRIGSTKQGGPRQSQPQAERLGEWVRTKWSWRGLVVGCTSLGYTPNSRTQGHEICDLWIRILNARDHVTAVTLRASARSEDREVNASEHAAGAAPVGNALVKPMRSAGQDEARAQGRKLPAGFAGPCWAVAPELRPGPRCDASTRCCTKVAEEGLAPRAICVRSEETSAAGALKCSP